MRPATSIYGISKEEIDQYRVLVKEKLGISASARIVELIHQDVASLTGKPVLTNNEGITKLSARLESLTKRRDDVMRILRQHKTFDRLVDEAEVFSELHFDPPDREKQTITDMLKAFKQGKIDENIGLDDFTLFIGLIEIGIERHKILGRLSQLRLETYCTESEVQQPNVEVKQPAENQETATAEEKDNEDKEPEEEEEEGDDKDYKIDDEEETAVEETVVE